MMKLIVPKYVKKFKCVAADCKDSCCVDWEIPIDREALERYKTADGEMKSKLEKNIEYGPDGAHFVLKNGRCSFLRDDGLCEMICAMGEGALCDICREHPRYYTVLGDVTYGGIGLCCESAAELILSENKPHEYCEIQNYLGEYQYCDKEIIDKILPIKQTIVDIFADKTVNYGVKINRVLEKVVELQKEIDGEEFVPFPDMDKDLAKSATLEVFNGFEYIGEELLPLIDKGLDKLLSGVELGREAKSYLDNILIYFTDRYMTAACSSGDALSALTVILTSGLVIGALFAAEDNVDFSRAVYIAHLYSKEIEYNEDSLAVIEEMTGSGLLDAVCALFKYLI